MAQTVLVVDDEKDIVELIRYNLSQAGYRVVTAGDGQQALDLVLRVHAILRRDGREDTVERIVFDPLVIDLAAHTVTVRGREVGLTSTEFKLLHRLARRPGRAFGRDQLLSDVWGYSGDLET